MLEIYIFSALLGVYLIISPFIISPSFTTAQYEDRRVGSQSEYEYEFQPMGSFFSSVFRYESKLELKRVAQHFCGIFEFGISLL